jgi:hypothetical protein
MSPWSLLIYTNISNETSATLFSVTRCHNPEDITSTNSMVQNRYWRIIFNQMVKNSPPIPLWNLNIHFTRSGNLILSLASLIRSTCSHSNRLGTLLYYPSTCDKSSVFPSAFWTELFYELRISPLWALCSSQLIVHTFSLHYVCVYLRF